MGLPRIEIDVSKVEANTRTLTEICGRSGIEVAGVTKATCGDPQVARAMLRGGATVLADSRIENIRRMRGARLNVPFLLLRSPQPSDARNVVRWADISLNSELDTLQALGHEATRLRMEHGAILMVDLGDRREGVMPDELPALVEGALDVKGIRVEGIGTNLACYGGIVPTHGKMERLLELAHDIEQRFGLKMSTISGGNSANILLQMDDGHPEGITQLRLGESILLGLETVDRTPIPGTYQDAFRIVGELVEVKRKPSMPSGETGQDAFGHAPEIEDRGVIMEGILALGRQDVDPDSLLPESSGVDILGASSDHLILDLGDNGCSVGDRTTFIPGYGSLLRAMTSSYVDKVYV